MGSWPGQVGPRLDGPQEGLMGLVQGWWCRVASARGRLRASWKASWAWSWAWCRGVGGAGLVQAVSGPQEGLMGLVQGGWCRSPRPAGPPRYRAAPGPGGWGPGPDHRARFFHLFPRWLRPPWKGGRPKAGGVLVDFGWFILQGIRRRYCGGCAAAL